MSKGKRSISDRFLKQLKSNSDVQNVLLNTVRQDLDFCFEPREDHVTIYYRGKVMMEIKPHRKEPIECVFKGDARGDRDVSFQSNELSEELIKTYREKIDSYLAETKEWPEAKYQFRIAHANSINVSDDDCFLFVDSEYYQRKKDKWRLDIVAINKKQGILSLIEVKYGNDSLRTRLPDKHGKNGNPGIRKHLEDFNIVKNSCDILQTMKNDFVKVIKQKEALGLIGSMPDSLDFRLDKVEFLFVICNYDFSDNRNLKDELNEIKANKELDRLSKENTFFCFPNYTESYRTEQEYKLNPKSFVDYESVMKKLASKG